MLSGGSDLAVPAFLNEGGAAGAALRALDWAAAGLPQPAAWDPALRSAVALCLHAAVPVAVFWGDRRHFIFGDAWVPLLGPRAAGAMARPAAEVWPDLWPVIGPQLDQVAHGAALSAVEAPVPLAAPRGGPGPETWWTYSLSPVLDSAGRRMGVLATVLDVTDQVLGRRRQVAIVELAERFARLHDAEQIVRLGCEVIGRTLGASRVGRGIVDAAGDAVRVSGTWCNGLPTADGLYPAAEFWRDWTAGPDPAAAIVDDVSADARTAARARGFQDRGVASFMTVPALGDGQVRMLTFVQGSDVRHWRASDLAFVQDVIGRGRAAADRARAEVALGESNTRNRHSIALSPLFMWTARPDGGLDHLDERLAALTGNPGLGGRWAEVLHADDQAPSIAAWADAVRHGTPYDIEHRILVHGFYRWMRSRAVPQLDDEGRVLKWYGSTEDIDEARRAAAALATSEARLRAVTDSVDQMIWSTLPDGAHDYFNQTWYDYTGVPPGSTDGEGWSAIFHPDDRQRAWDTWHHSLHTGEPYHIEYRLRHRTGIYRWVLGRAHPVRDAAGRIERWYGTCTDIQEIVEAREVLARSRADLERLVADTAADRERMWRLSTELMAILRGDGTVTAVNPACQRVLGWAPGELIGQDVTDLLHEGDRAPVRAALRRLRAGRPVAPFENRIRGKDGSYRMLSWTAVPEGGLIHAIGRDNTAERHAAAQLEAAQDVLRQAQKMEAVGQLTGGIAHDFNNMLAIVIGSLDLLGRRLDPADARARRYVDNAMEGARRAATLTNRLLAFSRQQKLTPVVLDLRALLGGMADWLRSSLGASIQLDLSHGPALWRTLADQNQLENAILNLAVNARDAMPEGGRLRIATANETVAPGAAGPVPPGDYVTLSVSDTGEGIPPGLIDRVFDPFFTTKEVGKGTGLGLSQVYGFVTQSGGHVGLSSRLGEGTTIIIRLPPHAADTVVEAGTEGAPAVPPVPAGQHPPGAVLVVEDELAVRRFTAEAVAELGYRVLEADGADAALAVLDGPEEVSLLLTDIVMPDVNGRTLAKEAVRRRPGLKLLFVSGFSRDDDSADGPAMLPKPFTVDQLAAALWASLAPR